jgi:hypothetical protein
MRLYLVYEISLLVVTHHLDVIIFIHMQYYDIIDYLLKI